MNESFLITPKPSPNFLAAAASVIAVSRWYGVADVTVAAGEGSALVTPKIGFSTRIEDLIAALSALQLDAATLVIEPEDTAVAVVPSMTVRWRDNAFSFDSVDAPPGLAGLATQLLTAIHANPSAALADLVPDRFAPIIGSQPPPLRGLDLPMTSACVDMASGISLTADELELRVESFAATLAAHGIGPGAVVGVALPRGIESVAAWVAILRVGAAFMQIDPELPLHQRRYMVGEAAPSILLAETVTHAAELGSAALVLTLDAVSSGHVEDLPHPDPRDPAYLIFTSGSTGRPKAVQIGHAAMDHHSRAVADAFQLSPADRVLSFAATGFDVCIEEVLPTLRAGATLILRSEEMLDTLDHFVDGLHRHQITVLNIPTAFWQLLTGNLSQAGSRVLPKSLRLVIVGGERVSSATLEKWRAVAPDVRWMNGYGPTEATATATLYLDDGLPVTTDSVPIGSPLGAAQLALFAPDGSPAPVGRPGELWIGGAGVGLGYVNRPEETAARFRSLPGAAGADCAMWYRTGDRCRPVGRDTLEFLDRMDRQLKLSGYRIEPGGIEAALLAVPGTNAARVAVHHGALAVWVAGTADQDALLQVLHDELPRGVSPLLTTLPEMPLNARGKLDDDALRQMLSHTRASPYDPADGAVAEIGRIMGDLLGQPALEANESFFDHGGNSLLAIKLSEQLIGLFGRPPTLPTIYNHPSPQALSQVMEQATDREDCVMTIQPHGDGVPLLGLHVLGENGRFYHPLAAALKQAHPVWGMTLGLLTADTPTDIEGAAHHYFQQIQKFRPHGPVALAGVSLGAFVAFEVAARLRGAGRDVPLIAIFDADGPAPSARSTLPERISRAFSRLRSSPIAALQRYGKWAHGELALMRQVVRLRVGGMLGVGVSNSKLSDFIAANILSVAAYEPRVYAGRVLIFVASDDLALPERVIGSGLGWAEVAPNRRVEIVAGDHLGILADPGVNQIARVIAEELSAVTPAR